MVPGLCAGDHYVLRRGFVFWLVDLGCVVRTLDYIVLFATLLTIAGYGIWRTRCDRGLQSYLKGDASIRWGTIGLSVMATQASAVTFLSMPGLAYESGMAFVQNYFGMPFAIILICIFFIPIYQRLRVYTAYEYLGQRFDLKTRLLGASLFLVQRGLAAGITIYAPAIIISTLLGWSLDLTVLLTGLVVIVYTVSGGTKAVSLTQRYQMGVIFLGMGVAFVLILIKLPPDISWWEAVQVAGKMERMQVVDFSFDPKVRYTFWSGMLGGLFLSLSYFGTDQSQVQRYLAGASITESRAGLLFNAIVKIPMQFFILFVGVMVFVFYQFERPPLFFNGPAWERLVATPGGEVLTVIDAEHSEQFIEKEAALRTLAEALRAEDAHAVDTATAHLRATQKEADALRAEAKAALLRIDPLIETKDSDYIFITFVIHHLPVGVVGLLMAVIFSAAMSSTASELNALGSTTTVDFYRSLIRPHASDAHYVTVSKLLTAGWGVVALGFAVFASLVENLVEAVNILGSIFYGVILVAFFLRFVGGTAVFFSAVVSQALVLILYNTSPIGYLWYNVIGCTVVVVLALLLQLVLPRSSSPREVPA